MSMGCGNQRKENEKLYPYQNNILTYRSYRADCFKNKECDFKVKIVVGM